jgi:hypothetical protein
VRITTFAAGSAAIARTAPSSAAISSPFRALRRAGRLRVMIPIRSLVSVRITGPASAASAATVPLFSQLAY